MNDDTYITEINTAGDAFKMMNLILDSNLGIPISADYMGYPRIDYHYHYTFSFFNLLSDISYACGFGRKCHDPYTLNHARNAFSIFFNETMPEGHRVGFFSILDWEVDEIMNITTPPELIGRTPRPKELYPKITIGTLKQHLLDTVRKYKQFEVELKKKEIKDAVLGYEGN